MSNILTINPLHYIALIWQRSALHHKTGLRPANLKNVQDTLVGAKLVFVLYRI